MTEPTAENTITSDYTDLEKPFLDPNLYKVPKNEAIDDFSELSWWLETPVTEVVRPRDDS